ncbi:MAG: VacB/RNase II family 3'-5' exoribonuclease [Luminiphilus sp.]|jgi:VacB/RNase II family 3'-5' exoribonuclease
MLDRNAMAQLKGLRDELEAQNERTEATIKGTQHRYGFAVTADGREIFVPPDEMLKVLPGDKAAICIRPAAPIKGKKDKGGRTVAEIERLIETGLDNFVGHIVQKGKATFVVPDIPGLSRWLFIPPHARNGVAPGDLVACALLRHPIKDGKPSAKVLERLGDQTTPGVENRYCAARAGLPEPWTDKTAEPLVNAAQSIDPLSDASRLDLTHLSFVSIDAARTVDIDDALHAEVTQAGWQLSVAVADPTAYLASMESLPEQLAQRGASVYFHGDMIAMLPEAISQGLCALAEDVARPALVCQMQVTESGEISDFSFHKAVIRSRAKLAYAAVDRYVTGNSDELIAHTNPLEALVQVYRTLRGRREAQELVMEERREYRWILGEDKQIAEVDSFEKLASQHLVEECMIAANKCAAQFLQAANAPGPFVVHRGFRGDRIEEAKTFLEKHRPELKDTALDTVAGYRAVLADLGQETHGQPLRDMVNRLLSRAVLTEKAGPHMGLATEAYTNFTSPLRKALDFFVHLQITACLAGNSAANYPVNRLADITRAIGRGREAVAAADRRLTARYLLKLKKGGKQRFTGHVSHITSSGFTVKLDENGLEGLVDLRPEKEKFSFDKWTMSLTSTTRRFQLMQSVEVDFAEAPAEGDYLALFKLTEGCGLKPQKETPAEAFAKTLAEATTASEQDARQEPAEAAQNESAPPPAMPGAAAAESNTKSEATPEVSTGPSDNAATPGDTESTVTPTPPQ